MAAVAAVALEPFPHRDDDLVAKTAFSHVFALDEAYTEAVAALHACKRADAETQGRKSPGKQAASSSPQRLTSGTQALHGAADSLYPQYLVRGSVSGFSLRDAAATDRAFTTTGWQWGRKNNNNQTIKPHRCGAAAAAHARALRVLPHRMFVIDSCD